MKKLSDLIRENGFLSENDMDYGTYNDMHVIFKRGDACLSVFLYLALPAQGKAQRVQLENELNEKGARFSASVAPSGHPSFLRIDFAGRDEDISRVERYLSECDLLLRPYGREMGMLCAFCKKELGEEKPVYKTEGDFIVPVCGACSALESGAGVKKVKNRGDQGLRLTTKSACGFLIGFLTACVAWGFFFTFAGGFISYFISIALAFIIKGIFEKFGGSFRNMPVKKTMAFLMVVSVFSVLLGSAGAMTVNMVSVRNQLMEQIEYMENTYGDDDSGDAVGTTMPELPEGSIYSVLNEENSMPFFVSCFASILAEPYFYRMNIIPVIFAAFGGYLAGRQRYRR